MTKSRHILAPRHRWTEDEIAWVTALYPDLTAELVAAAVGGHKAAIYQLAARLNLSKSDEFKQSDMAMRTSANWRPGRSSEFKPGHASWNKGMKGMYAPGCEKGWFKPGVRQGVAVRLYKPIGTERISKDGYLERKINDGIPLQKRWRAVHLLKWEAVNGPLPRGHAIAFLDGDKRNTAYANLELITRRELMARNSVHNLPKPVAQAVQLLGALRRKINARSRK